MTDIRYRAFRKPTKFYSGQMFYDIQNAYDGFGVYTKEEAFCPSSSLDSFGSYLEGDNYAVEQYIGVRDKQNQSIYVGDFVFNEYQGVSSAIQLVYAKEGIFYATGSLNGQNIIPNYYHNYLTVLGNVHEDLRLYTELSKWSNITLEEAYRIKSKIKQLMGFTL